MEKQVLLEIFLLWFGIFIGFVLGMAFGIEGERKKRFKLQISINDPDEECPNCGEPLIETHDNMFECRYCSYSREILEWS